MPLINVNFLDEYLQLRWRNYCENERSVATRSLSNRRRLDDDARAKFPFNTPEITGSETIIGDDGFPEAPIQLFSWLTTKKSTRILRTTFDEHRNTILRAFIPELLSEEDSLRLLTARDFMIEHDRVSELMAIIDPMMIHEINIIFALRQALRENFDATQCLITLTDFYSSHPKFKEFGLSRVIPMLSYVLGVKTTLRYDIATQNHLRNKWLKLASVFECPGALILTAKLYYDIAIATTESPSHRQFARFKLKMIAQLLIDNVDHSERSSHTAWLEAHDLLSKISNDPNSPLEFNIKHVLEHYEQILNFDHPDYIDKKSAMLITIARAQMANIQARILTLTSPNGPLQTHGFRFTQALNDPNILALDARWYASPDAVRTLSQLDQRYFSRDGYIWVLNNLNPNELDEKSIDRLNEWMGNDEERPSTDNFKSIALQLSRLTEIMTSNIKNTFVRTVMQITLEDAQSQPHNTLQNMAYRFLNDDCAITQEPIINKLEPFPGTLQHIALTPSGHFYHREPLAQWVRSHRNDPQTRRQLRIEDIQIIDGELERSIKKIYNLYYLSGFNLVSLSETWFTPSAFDKLIQFHPDIIRDIFSTDVDVLIQINSIDTDALDQNAIDAINTQYCQSHKFLPWDAVLKGDRAEPRVGDAPSKSLAPSAPPVDDDILLNNCDRRHPASDVIPPPSFGDALCDIPPPSFGAYPGLFFNTDMSRTFHASAEAGPATRPEDQYYYEQEGADQPVASIAAESTSDTAEHPESSPLADIHNPGLPSAKRDDEIKTESKTQTSPGRRMLPAS